MAVTESYLDPKVRKISLAFYVTYDLSIRSCGWNVVYSNKPIESYTVKKKSHHFDWAQFVPENFKNLFQPRWSQG